MRPTRLSPEVLHMSKSKEKIPTDTREREFGSEIWGIIFVGMGLLVLIALVSQFVSGRDNLFGPLGGGLSLGLVRVLGSVPSMFVPVAILVLGVQVFRGSRIPIRLLG